MNRGADILGVGLVCAVGLRARFAAAATRAGIARFGESTHFDRRGQPLIFAAVPQERLPPVPSAGLAPFESRLARLALAAAQEALQALPLDRPRPSSPSLALGLPTPPPGTSQYFRPDPVTRTIVAALDRRIDAACVDVHSCDRVSGLAALATALARIERGAPLALALATDSFDEPTLLAALDRDDRLRADGVYDGFIPGEAGAAVLLAAPGLAARLGRPALARLAGVSLTEEPGHLYSSEPHRADGLAAAIRHVLADYPTLKIGSVFAGLNGESLFAKEWGVAVIRNHPHFPDDCRLEHPADCLGDTGAASGLLLTALATQRHDAGPTLVWSAADHAPRAAALLLETQ